MFPIMPAIHENISMKENVFVISSINNITSFCQDLNKHLKSNSSFYQARFILSTHI